MNKSLILTGLILSSLLTAQGAVAGSNCHKKSWSSVCESFVRQQNAPALLGPKAKTTVSMRSIAVLSDVPSALTLRKGTGNGGPKLMGFRKESISWQQTNRGWEATVYVPLDFFYKHTELTLCGANGNSSWNTSQVSYIKHSNVTASDPACTAGSGYCAQYGL